LKEGIVVAQRDDVQQ